MENISVRKEDQILMSLVHYFVTKENYTPIFVHGVKDEIWLEKVDGPYRVIRINSHRIFNEEQFKFDQYKIKDILRQIKKKTMSFKINALNINLNADEDLKLEMFDNIDNVKVNGIKDVLKNETLLEVFPNIQGNLIDNPNGVELIFNVTKDINEKTEKDNKKFEKIFSPKKTYITYGIIGLCLIMYLVLSLFGGPNGLSLLMLGANYGKLIKSGQVWRLITYAFLHGGVAHLLCNMYSLSIIGAETESRFGKIRFLGIYLLSAIGGGLLSAVLGDYVSVGASGAIFGLLGAMVYFGSRFRIYFRQSINSKFMPVILLNLFIGFVIPGIDNYCHIGGLITGYLAAMTVGIPEDNKKSDRINGVILLTVFIAFLGYLIFFR